MYAVIKSGGKQHRVVEGETLRLEKLDIATGDNIDFEEVLMVGEGADVKIGAPLVKGGGKVTAEVISHCLLYTSPSPRDGLLSRMPSSA